MAAKCRGIRLADVVTGMRRGGTPMGTHGDPRRGGRAGGREAGGLVPPSTDPSPISCLASWGCRGARPRWLRTPLSGGSIERRLGPPSSGARSTAVCAPRERRSRDRGHCVVGGWLRFSLQPARCGRVHRVRSGIRPHLARAPRGQGRSERVVDGYSLRAHSLPPRGRCGFRPTRSTSVARRWRQRLEGNPPSSRGRPRAHSPGKWSMSRCVAGMPKDGGLPPVRKYISLKASFMAYGACPILKTEV
jgi:hypothetical protein